jgi:hypothetical protein
MEFPLLSRFFDSYFHQDWGEEFASVSELATHFGSTGPIEDVFVALGEGAVLLARFNESEVRSFLFDAYYFYETDVASEWLREMLSDVAAAAALRP